MIEQTEFIVSEWHYHEPDEPITNENDILCRSSLDVMRKRSSTKKGIAFRISSRFMYQKKMILDYAGENSYVIDFDEVIDKRELQKMIRNSFTQFSEKFELRRIGTVLEHRSVMPLDESLIDFDAILPLLE
ncbi:MAG: hypothetical protein IPP79_09775 [Chitinophagaceae bacterium]|nr:hypothetical protein [Chitinophagaceae bacterium]